MKKLQKKPCCTSESAWMMEDLRSAEDIKQEKEKKEENKKEEKKEDKK